MTSLIRHLQLFGLSLFPILGIAQSTNDLVRWEFTVDRVVKDAAVLNFSATVAPGWHLYSQCIKEGGPMPTEFTFETSNKFVLNGKPEENGEPITFYDSIYEMDVIWFSGSVDFFQLVQDIKEDITVKGRIEYMVCNDHMCIPDKVDFRFDL